MWLLLVEDVAVWMNVAVAHCFAVMK